MIEVLPRVLNLPEIYYKEKKGMKKVTTTITQDTKPTGGYGGWVLSGCQFFKPVQNKSWALIELTYNLDSIDTELLDTFAG